MSDSVKKHPTTDRLLTATEASVVLGVNRATIWRWAKSGRLRAAWGGRAPRPGPRPQLCIPAAEVARLLAEGDPK